MNNIRKSLLFPFMFLGFLGCNTNDDNSMIKEEAQLIYEGVFTVRYLDGSTYSNKVTINFEGNKYACTAGKNQIPAGGSGTFKQNVSTLMFDDGNIWTTNIEGGLILNGEYSYTMKKDSLRMIRGGGNRTLYTYDLKKGSE